MGEKEPDDKDAAADGARPVDAVQDADCNGHALAESAAPEQPAEPEAREAKEDSLISGRKHRTAALQAAEVIAYQAEQAELADMLDEEGGAYEALSGPFDPLTSSVSKGPRTIRKRNPEDGAGGFASSQLLKSRSGLAPGEEATINPQQDEGLKAELICRAAAVRDIMGVASDRGIALREVLKGGVLAGQAVYFQSRHGPILNKGTLTQEGQIACECKQCRPGGVIKTQSISCSEFEEHAGSRERRPAESIFLQCITISLKEFCNLVNCEERCEDRHASACLVCGDGGDLLCCDACPNAVHPTCVSLETVPEGEWFCQACVERGHQPKVKQGSPPKPRKVKAPKSASGSGKSAGPKKGSGTAKKSALSLGLAKSRPATGRVHMAAPAQRAVSGARRERNSNKHKRLFLPNEPGGLIDGQPVAYITSQGEELLKGAVRIDPDPEGASGILCACCNTVISCSQFEAHAGRGSRRAPYDNIFTADGLSLRKVASMMPSDEAEAPLEYQKGSIGAIADRRSRGKMEPELITVAGEAASQGGCVLCTSPDFLRGGFGERTMIICDQCEREFHIGCLAEAGRARLTELPDGAWFCSPDCHRIAGKMRSNVSSVPVPLDDKYSWQILRGKDGTHATAWALRAAQDILTESFDPIVELTTGADLMLAMVYAQELGDWDYSGMYTAVLKHKGKAVCAAVFRVFGPQMAEVPLVATRLEARRQGHARVLMDAFEKYFASLGVASICLPSAQETIVTWTEGFGFQHMSEERLAATRSELHVLIFPGTELLHKPLNPAPQDASSYPMKVQAPAQPKEALDAAAAAKAQQTPEERAAALAAAEKAVEDISLSVGGALPPSAEALAPAAEEGGAGAEEKAAEPGEVSSPRAAAAGAPASSAQPEQALQPDSATAADDAAQPMQTDAEAPQEGPAAQEQDTSAAADPAEAAVVAAPASNPAADDAAADQTVPDAPSAAVKAADDAAEPGPDRAAGASPKRKAAAESVLKQASVETVAAAEVAASEQGASAEQAGSKRLKTTAAEPEAPAEVAQAGTADPTPQLHADSAPGDTVPSREAAAAPAPQPSAEEKAAEPNSTRKRKTPAADLASALPAAETSNSPESQRSRSLSGRTTRSRQAILGSAAASQGADAVPGEPAARQVAEQPAKPRSRARAAGSSEPAHNQAGATPAISPNSSNERSISRRSLRSQAEPGSTPPHKQEQAGPAVKSTLRRASRSRSSMQREDRGSPRGDSAAAAHEAAGPVLGSKQLELPATRAAVQALLNGPFSSRRLTRSDTQEHTLVAAGASRLDSAPSGRSAALSGEPLPCTGAVPLACVKGDAQEEALAEAAGPGKGPELVSESVSAGRPHQPGSSKPTAGKGPAEPPRDAASAPVARVGTKDAALPDQAYADNSSLGRAPAAPADGTPAQGPKQEPAAGGAQREAKKARRSSGLREILSLALESGAAAGASAVPVTWDGSADNRRASRAKPSLPSITAQELEPKEDGSKAAGATAGTASEAPAKRAAAPRNGKAEPPGEVPGKPNAAEKGAAAKGTAAAKKASDTTAKAHPVKSPAPAKGKTRKGVQAVQAAAQKPSGPAVTVKQAGSKAPGGSKASGSGKDKQAQKCTAKTSAKGTGGNTGKRKQKADAAQPATKKARRR
ncbi:hypothetical protein CVIRNUC_000397 [Coccomyxa viridis]|uniref:Uncharacterized protein n=1 Tax=Coccomyxa viridis TaxID=1274662 RepID=A0AAV1HQK7_9CHLO|nr:hypothetical protein CVIRNUC_000397 [Coccomyxa viridis]